MYKVAEVHGGLLKRFVSTFFSFFFSFCFFFFYERKLTFYRLLCSGFTLMVTLLLRADASFSMLLCGNFPGSEFVVSLLDTTVFSGIGLILGWAS